MVQLVDDDIQNKDVMNWSGIHIFHFAMSSCSQKLRIYLNLKGIDWHSHVVNLSEQENCQLWFMQINPRGLVPVLVMEGAVHIESNDIIKVLEQRFPHPELIPKDKKQEIFQLLEQEDNLHLDLRRLSFRFVYGRMKSPKQPEYLSSYVNGGSGTVRGKVDLHKKIEAEFYQQLDKGGLGDDACKTSALKFQAAFDDLEMRLEKNPYLLGEKINVVDIAWFVYAHRLDMAGYPFRQLHPGINKWFQRLSGGEEFSSEVKVSEKLETRVNAARDIQVQNLKTLSHVANFTYS